ncbi:hypothetical protein VHEMI05625 [[Torrubiella] hemipterigena]|uniref:Uncharacterized protein n=1 Tax=[Torrubiella] hemipterigena TaxID=1531966 RepID=A0A0A1SYG6_9HYPO|nr:hypothetical protein VHEMI05625 [[Torrubiella] hemipterigena]
MRFAIPFVALSSLASALVAPQDDSFFLDNVPLDKRQTGDPTYQCHANCGYTIQKGVGDYCKNEEWLGLLRGCLDCALQYDIWKSYGNKVSAAAKACGLDATPKAVSPGGNASSSSNAGSVAPSSLAPPAQQSSHASSVAPVTTSAAATSAPRSATTSAGQPAQTTSAGHSNNGTTTVPTGAAAAMKQQLPLAAAGALLAVLVM